MDFGIVVTGCDSLSFVAGFNRLKRRGAQAGIVTGPSEGHEAAVIGRHRGEVECDVGEVRTQALVALRDLVSLHRRHAVLGNQDTAGREAPFAARVEFFGEQRLAGADGVAIAS